MAAKYSRFQCGDVLVHVFNAAVGEGPAVDRDFRTHDEAVSCRAVVTRRVVRRAKTVAGATKYTCAR